MYTLLRDVSTVDFLDQIPRRCFLRGFWGDALRCNDVTINFFFKEVAGHEGRHLLSCGLFLPRRLV